MNKNNSEKYFVRHALARACVSCHICLSALLSRINCQHISRLVKEFENKLQEPVSDEYYNLFDTLSGFYLNNRYPDYKMDFVNMVSENIARELFGKSREVFAWLQTLRP